MDMPSPGWQQAAREEGTVVSLECRRIGGRVTRLVELTGGDPAVFAAKEDDQVP